MKSIRKMIVIGLVFLSLGFVHPVFAQTCDSSCSSTEECQQKIAKCQEAWNQMEVAKKPHVDALQKMEADIAAFLSRIKSIEGELAKKATEIATGEKELGSLLVVANRRIRSFYMRTSNTNLLATLLASKDIGATLRNYGYQQAVTNEDKRVITQTAVMVKELEDKKKKLEGERATLAAMKEDVDKRAVSVRKLVAEANAYEAKLTSTMASLSAKQQEFLGAKLAGLGIPLYAMSGGGCSSDLTNGKDPGSGFNGAFGFFTFGVPNRVGLNQYGAYGRAKAGQTYDQILHAYYDFGGYKNNDDITIRVNDSNSYNSGNIIWTGPLNAYMKKIFEVPEDWPYESIKAQVIAARSYVVAATGNGASSICATQYCQVFKKDSEKSGNWAKAVDETERNVMIKDNSVIKAYFSSTHGGYAFNTGDLSGWSATSYTKRMVDTTTGSVSGFSDLKNNAYDKDSPWFYCDWGGRSSANGTAWLKPEEVADIVNVLLLVREDPSRGCFVFQTDKTPPAPDSKKGCPETGNWSVEKVKQELASRGLKSFASISNISISADFNSGMTTNVSISGDAGSVSFSANDFKNYFNQRAPANIQIVGPLFNVERK